MSQFEDFTRVLIVLGSTRRVRDAIMAEMTVVRCRARECAIKKVAHPVHPRIVIANGNPYIVAWSCAFPMKRHQSEVGEVLDDDSIRVAIKLWFGSVSPTLTRCRKNDLPKVLPSFRTPSPTGRVLPLRSDQRRHKRISFVIASTCRVAKSVA